MRVVMEAATTSAARVSRGLSLPGRRRRAAGERIAVLFEEHGRMVYGLSRLLLRDPVEAEDAAQQTFLSAYRALLAGQEPRDPSAWLGTIARNECRSRLRARQAEPLALVQEPAGEELQRDAARREEIQALCAALTELPPQQRDAVVLREFYGLSYAEVAAALGLSGAAVESLLFRGRKRLQEQLRPVRSALGVLTLPVTLRDSLAQALPGFGAAAAPVGAGGAVLAKLASAPLAAKVAALTLAVGTVGTVAGVEQARHAPRRPAAAPAPKPEAVPRSRATPVAVAVHAREWLAARPVAAQPVARVAPVSRVRAVAPVSSGSGGSDAEHARPSGGGSGEVEQEHRAAPTTPSSGGGDGGSGGSSGSGEHVSDPVSHDGSGGSGSTDASERGTTGDSGRDGSGSGGSGSDSGSGSGD
ncbi:MAG TPA: sigma-70 family RNA polymerase sigma factor [Gaiellaceae bacterium]|nr:sigma-70 family RNA polymerase sigma factor [Gaiellaceae bacterium]